MATDRNGQPVIAGTRVRVLEIASFLKRDLPSDEWQDLETMVGEVFEVYEIDEYGAAWVEKSFTEGDGAHRTHGLALASHEMEVVQADANQ
jgi:hypothetical protein